MSITLSTTARRAAIAPSGPRRARATAGWLGHLLGFAVVLGVTALLAVGVVVPRVTGATPYTILTSSMEPDLPPGTLVISRPVDPDEIGIGDVITYQLRSGEPAVVTHRVVSVGFTTAGDYVFVTQGDANARPDEEPVRAVQVRGEAWYAVPYVGRVTSLIDNDDRRLLSWAIGGALLTQGAWWLAEAYLRRRRRVPS